MEITHRKKVNGAGKTRHRTKGGKVTEPEKPDGVADGDKFRARSPSELLHHELEHVHYYGKDREEGETLGELLHDHDVLHAPSLTFCSLKTPWKRRLQTLAAAWHVGSFLYIFAFTLLALVNPLSWIFMVPYLVYYIFDRSPANGNVTKRYSLWFRRLAFWRYYCEYFPIKIHKTTDLEPTFVTEGPDASDKNARYAIVWVVRLWPAHRQVTFRFWKRKVVPKTKVAGPKYIFGYHPHGVAALGAFGAFGTEGCGWTELFPGIPTCLMTLINQFQIPFYRDYLLSLGVTSVSKKNALKVLQRDYSICIVVGGAQEALLSRIGNADLVLKRRKGFIKLAMETGNVSLVPCYAFGETDCYNILQTDDKSYLRRFQLWIKRNYGFTIPFFFARGLFNYDFGLIPFRCPINVVVGNPIHVKNACKNPSMKEIDNYQKLYVAELQRIFDTYKEQFGYKDLSLNLKE